MPAHRAQSLEWTETEQRAFKAMKGPDVCPALALLALCMNDARGTVKGIFMQTRAAWKRFGGRSVQET